MKTPVCVISCSPRAGGNSDVMCNAFAKGVQAAGAEVKIIYLRAYTVNSCIGCNSCSNSEDFFCPLVNKDKDGAEALFAEIKNASYLFFASPIYFYGLPAHFKALIDRSQRLWAKKDATENNEPLKKKFATVGLLAGRKRGEKLFEGSLLTLRCFLEVFDIEIADTCLLRGFDGYNDLSASLKTQQLIVNHGVKAIVDRI